ncbi:hypothetical protein, partial [Pseudomonas sp. BDAL1]|uniref:hypothetical protein n=1 Tax=Pseudomonas sp. BDAL1 TaxID=1884210 RepID=UPI00257C8B10
SGGSLAGRQASRTGPWMARCGDPRISVRAKEPDEVGPETGAKGFAYFGPIKVGRRGAKR